jgi:hypothetical protein
MLNLHDLKNEIQMLPLNRPVFIYIGVGAAATNRENALPQEHYHQFPPFLQDIWNKVPNLHLFLLLIDPQQEHPPRVTIDYELYDCSETHYRSFDDRLQVFVVRESVYTVQQGQDQNALDLTSTLADLNQFAIEKNVSLVYHDFTGRKTALIAEYFDRDIAEHLDQLVYGLSAREDHGCFFDLTQPNAYMPFRLEENTNNRPVVKLFNYYKFIVRDMIPASLAELQLYPQEMHSWAALQKNQIIQIIRDQFKNVNLSLLRQVRQLMLEPAPQVAAAAAQQDISGYMFNELPYLHRQIFVDIMNEKDYNLLYELLFNYSASELNVLAKLKDIDMDGEELLSFITLDEDPFKWFNNIVLL